MSLIEDYRRNVRTITVTDQTFSKNFCEIWAENCQKTKVFKIRAEIVLNGTFQDKIRLGVLGWPK